MRATLLKTADMPSMPLDLKVLKNWGDIIVYQEDDDKYISGDHLTVEGNESILLNWFRSVPWVWLKVAGTSPRLQKFEQWHF